MNKYFLLLSILSVSITYTQDDFDPASLTIEEAASQCEQVTITVSIRLDRAGSEIETWIKQLKPFHDQLSTAKTSGTNIDAKEAVGQLNAITRNVEETFLQNDAHGELSISYSVSTKDQE